MSSLAERLAQKETEMNGGRVGGTNIVLGRRPSSSSGTNSQTRMNSTQRVAQQQNMPHQ
jgi:hypothetical protein